MDGAFTYFTADIPAPYVMTQAREKPFMNTPLSLDALGPRICIMGPSNSGKSTLASAIAMKMSLPLIHLDQLYHLPDTQWLPRDPSAFYRLHAEAIKQEKWVIEGNYTKCIRERFERATGLILLDISTPIALVRYIRRCYALTPRIGGLHSGKDPVTWAMLKYITLTAPKNRLRHRALFDQTSLPKLLLTSPRAMRACYDQWGLTP